MPLPNAPGVRLYRGSREPWRTRRTVLSHQGLRASDIPAAALHAREHSGGQCLSGRTSPGTTRCRCAVAHRSYLPQRMHANTPCDVRDLRAIVSHLLPHVHADLRRNVCVVVPYLRPDLRCYVCSDLCPHLRPNLRPDVRSDLRPNLRPDLRAIVRDVLPDLRGIVPHLRPNLLPHVSAELPYH